MATEPTQRLIDRPLAPPGGAGRGQAVPAMDSSLSPTPSAEGGARRTLRAQIARLEREISSLVAASFPYHLRPAHEPAAPGPGPFLLDMRELERSRDALAGRLQELRARAGERAASERAARERLERMRLEPGRYKFARLPVRDLGEGGCGVWEVRPRRGLIGMLAGWWELKLSSGCPLARGSR